MGDKKCNWCGVAIAKYPEIAPAICGPCHEQWIELIQKIKKKQIELEAQRILELHKDCIRIKKLDELIEFYEERLSLNDGPDIIRDLKKLRDRK